MDKFALTAQLQLQAPQNLQQVARQVHGAFGDVNVNVKVRTDSRALQGINNDLEKLAKSGRKAGAFYDELGGILANATRRFAGISIATGTFLGLARAIKNSIGDAITFEKEMSKVAQALDASIFSTNALTKEIGNISKEFGTSSNELAKFGRIFAQAGFNAKQTTDSLKLLAKTDLTGTFGSMENTAEGIITSLSVFSKEAKGSAKQAEFLKQSFDAISKVSKEYAVESEDIITAIRRTGSVFQSAGGDLNELIAVFTSIRSVSRESADTIANGLKTITTRLQRSDTVDALKELGVNLVDLKGQFIGPQQALKELGIALQGLPDGSQLRNNILEQIGGVYQIGRLIPAIKNYAMQQEILNKTKKAGGDIDKDASTAQQTMQTKIKKTQEAFADLIRTITLSEGFKTVVDQALGFANAAIRIADSLKDLLPLLALYATYAGVKTGGAFIYNFMGGKTKTKATTSASKLMGNTAVAGYATGGFVSGAPGKDKNPAMLTDGEFVVNKKDAQKNKGLLAAVNSGRKVRMLAKGSKTIPGAGGSDNLDPIIQNLEHGLKNLIKVIGGPEAQKLMKALGGVAKVYKPDQVNLSSQRKQDLSDSGNVNGLYTTANQIVVNPNKANSGTISHELGHAADRSGQKGSLPNFGAGPQLPSMISGTINNIIAKAATETNVQGHSGETAKYKARPEEAFADLFKRADPEGKKLLVNLSSASTDSKKVDEALKKLYHSIESGQVSFDQKTNENIKNIAQSRGIASSIKPIATPQGPSVQQIAQNVLGINDPNNLVNPKYSPNKINKPNNQAFVSRSSLMDSAKSFTENKYGAMKSSSSSGNGGSGKPPRDVSSSGAADDASDGFNKMNAILPILTIGLLGASESANMLSDEQKKATQSAVAMGAMFYSVASGALPIFAEVLTRAQDSLKNFTGYFNKSAKETASVSGDITSKGIGLAGSLNLVIAGLSLLVVAIEYFSASLKQSSDSLRDKANKDLNKLGSVSIYNEKGQESKLNDIKKDFYKSQKLANASSNVWANAKEGFMTTGALGAVTGAAIGYSGYGDGVTENQKKSIDESTNAQYYAIRAVTDFSTQLEKSKNSLLKADASFNIISIAAEQASKNIDKSKLAFNRLSIAQSGIKYEDRSAEEKSVFNAAQDKRDEALKTAKNISGELLNSGTNKIATQAKEAKSSKEIEDLFNSKELMDVINKSTEYFSQSFENPGSADSVNQTKEFKNEAVENSKRLKDSLLQQFKAEQDLLVAREAEVRVMIAVNDSLNKLSQSALNLENNQEAIDIFNGSSSGGISTNRFSDISRVGDMKKFEQEARTSAKNGGIDQKIADELISSAKVYSSLRDGLASNQLDQLNNKGIKKNSAEGFAESEIRKTLEAISPDFKNSNKDAQKGLIAELKGKLENGKLNLEDIQKALEGYKNNVKVQGEVLNQSNAQQKQFTEQLKNTTIALIEAQAKIGELKAGEVDIRERGRQRMEDANKERLGERDINKGIDDKERARLASADQLLASGGVKRKNDLGTLYNNIDYNKDINDRSSDLLNNQPDAKYFSNKKEGNGLRLNRKGKLAPDNRRFDIIKEKRSDIQAQNDFSGQILSQNQVDLSNAKMNNITGLGDTLKESEAKKRANEEMLKDKSLSNDQRNFLVTDNQKLSSAIKVTTQELTRLSNQSDRAADVMGKIEKEKAKGDLVRGLATDVVTGGAEARMGFMEKMAGARNVAQTGTFQNLPEDLRKDVDNYIDQIAKIDPKNQMVQARNKARADDFEKIMGVKLGKDERAMIEGGATTKEQQLMQELNQINKEEIIAQQELIKAEIQNTNAIMGLINVIKGAPINPNLAPNQPVNPNDQKRLTPVNPDNVVNENRVRPTDQKVTQNFAEPDRTGSGLDISAMTSFTNNLKTTLESVVSVFPESMKIMSDSLNSVTASLNGIAQSLSNITMKHEINIDGQVNIAGFNVERVSEAIKDSLGEFISEKVVATINKNNSSYRTA